MRVLVVDDDRIGARMVEFLLSEQGYTVVTAESADAALVEIEQQLPDLLLLDVNLPEINGFELYTQLRERGLDIPVIFLTAKGEIERRRGGDDGDQQRSACVAELAAEFGRAHRLAHSSGGGRGGQRGEPERGDQPGADADQRRRRPAPRRRPADIAAARPAAVSARPTSRPVARA